LGPPGDPALGYVGGAMHSYRALGRISSRSGTARRGRVCGLCCGLLLAVLIAPGAAAAAANPLGFGAPVGIDVTTPFATTFTLFSVSCPTTSLCVGVDNAG